MEHLRYKRFFRHLLSAPFIYIMIVPLVFLDFFIEIYHRICFPLYGIEYVKRSNYVRIDRHKLSYLTFLQKINCVYCGYANSLFRYSAEIAACTEKYWCGIKHKPNADFIEPNHHKDFAKYGDKEDFEKKYKK